MEDPVLVEVTRGPEVESRHAGAFAVVDAEGGLVLSAGDLERPVFPRSAVKVIQALPLIESGAADRFGLTEAELALACASHSGEPLHAETAAAMLRKAGQEAGCLECGTHWPSNAQAARDLARSGAEATALHNNCSGKHAGFVCTACALGVDVAGYVRPGHQVQQEVKAALEDVTGTALDAARRGTDGCSIPTYAIPLRALAHGFARIGTGHGFGPARAAAAKRLRAAVAANPFLVAGTKRADTVIMQALGERAFTKVGAEGVFCAALPEQGLGIAIKCEDGAGRAAEVVLASLLLRLLDPGEAGRGVLAPLANPVLRNWNGIEVGSLRPAAALA
ncbi:asparaginase [Roseomonas mucosa]|uniref:asparaginase n=1 Tax=Roseomonas mucosa TaxID=207340 RepID=UPI002B417237|nr:asparaginase [Roseomonas mucosa]QDD98351.1 L-asparaginase [Roseomonas mucosa]